MKVFNNILAVTVVSFLLGLVLPSDRVTGQGDKIRPEMKFKGSKVINITSDEIRKGILTVESGTTVVWLNNTRRFVEIEFTGKQVTMACASPVNFYLNDEGTFISGKIDPNAVSSLCFIEKGEFEYLVVVRGFGQSPFVPRRLTGKVIVK
jgi:hypothetical protein